MTRPGSRISAPDLERLTDEVEAVLVAGWRDESREAWHIASDIVAATLDNCLTVAIESQQQSESSQLERGN